jgi:TolA-binding protein
VSLTFSLFALQLSQESEESQRSTSEARQQVQEKVAERERLEHRIRHLERRIEAEQQSQSVKEVSARIEWQQETGQLLQHIQKECNSVFDRNGKAVRVSKSNSPRTVFTDFAFEKENDSYGTVSPWSMSEPSLPARAPSTCTVATATSATTSSGDMDSELDRALDETEAIVRSLLSNDNYGV